jgi:hypothetical protein
LKKSGMVALQYLSIDMTIKKHASGQVQPCRITGMEGSLLERQESALR